MQFYRKNKDRQQGVRASKLGTDALFAHDKTLDENTKYYINPTGRFVLGGTAADIGLTGRKIICDTYDGIGHHGGGAYNNLDKRENVAAESN